MDASSQERSRTPAGSKPGSSKVAPGGANTRAKALSKLERSLAEVVTLEDAERVLNTGGWAVIGQTWTAGAVSQLILQLTSLVDVRDAPLVKALSIVVLGMAEDDMAATIARAVMAEIAEPIEQLKKQQQRYDAKAEEMEQLSTNVSNGTSELQNEITEFQGKVQSVTKTWEEAGRVMKMASEKMKATAAGMQKDQEKRESATLKEADQRKKANEETARCAEEAAKRVEESANRAEDQRRIAAEETAKRIEEAAKEAAERAPIDGGGGASPPRSYAGAVKVTQSAKLAME